MISSSALDKLVQHNFIDYQTKTELEHATIPFGEKLYTVSSTLKTLISEIEKYELDQPLGIVWNEEQHMNNGIYSIKKKTYRFYSNVEVEYTLEEIKNYYKLVTFLQLLNIS